MNIIDPALLAAVRGELLSPRVTELVDRFAAADQVENMELQH